MRRRQSFCNTYNRNANEKQMNTVAIKGYSATHWLATVRMFKTSLEDKGNWESMGCHLDTRKRQYKTTHIHAYINLSMMLPNNYACIYPWIYPWVHPWAHACIDPLMQTSHWMEIEYESKSGPQRSNLVDEIRTSVLACADDKLGQ